MAFKREDKYLVVKTEDVGKFLHPNDGEKLEEILEIIGSGRKLEGKEANSYVVVNEDEPYSDIVWKLIQAGEEGWEESKWEEGVRQLINYVVRYTMDNYILISNGVESEIKEAVERVLAAARAGYRKV